MPHEFLAELTGKNRKCVVPTECPICHHKVTIPAPSHLWATKSDVQALFVCPNPDCRNSFLAIYALNESQVMEVVKFLPHKIEAPEIQPSVQSISPKCVSIFEEALQAKELGLGQIAGPGFRKACEFLIKDYAKSLSDPSVHSSIEKNFSAKVVKDHIHDTRIQELAERALWLGNDETHYLKVWKDRDIDDLILLLKLLFAFIEVETLAKRIVTSMPHISEQA